MAVGDALSSLALRRRSGFACMDGWLASLLRRRRATNYHTFGSDSVRPPIVWTRPKCERAKTYSIYRSNYKAVLAFYSARCTACTEGIGRRPNGFLGLSLNDRTTQWCKFLSNNLNFPCESRADGGGEDAR